MSSPETIEIEQAPADANHGLFTLANAIRIATVLCAGKRLYGFRANVPENVARAFGIGMPKHA